METGISKAVKLAGSQTALAKIVGLTPQAVQKWEAQGYVPTPKYCLRIEEHFEHQVTRYELNPEIYGAAGPESASAPPEEQVMP